MTTLFGDDGPNVAGEMFLNELEEMVIAHYEKWLTQGYSLYDMDDLAENALGHALCVVRARRSKAGLN